MPTGDITISPRTRLLIDGAAAIAFVSLVFYVGAWKAQQEEAVADLSRQIEGLSGQVAALAARPITSEADRRLSVAESQISAQMMTVAELKADIGKRLDRVEAQNDAILRELRARR